jgi:hypothetical protein
MRPLLLLTLFAVTGCRFGEARFESSVQGRPFDPSGTTFLYVDQRDANLVVEEDPRVAVVSTWIIFDPNSDLNDLEGSQLEDYSHEVALRDALALVFDKQSEVLEVGAAFKSVQVNGEERGDGRMLSRVHLSPERLTGASTYDDVIPLASERTVDVTITGETFDTANPVLSADVTITFARTDSDPGNVRDGQFTGSFNAPLVGERAAEHNLSLLEVDGVLGLPLAPRVIEEGGE